MWLFVDWNAKPVWHICFLELIDLTMEKRKQFVVAFFICALFCFTTVSSSCANSKKIEKEDYKQMALLAFERYEKVWDFSDFWKRGNTFDACLVFAKAVNEQWPDDPQVKKMNRKIVEMAAKNLDFYMSVNFGVMWADDFGWWGLMALNAREFLLQQGEVELADKYWNLSDKLCWEHKKNVAYDHTKTALPVPHGCRNGDANGQSLGVKNTVTNVLLFLLSTRIYEYAEAENREGTDKYLEMAYAQWLWFNEWFKLEEYEFLKNTKPNGALVQERPIAMFDGSSYKEKEHPYWDGGWVWTGDQGMLVAALTDMIAFKDDLAEYVVSNKLDTNFDTNEFEARARSIIQQIGKGVENVLIAESDGLIREAPCFSSFGPVHAGDYLAGRGIMMRYLGSEREKANLDVNLDEATVKTAQAIWNTRNASNNQFQPEYTTEENDKLYIVQFLKRWGTADYTQTWELKNMPEDHKNGVSQAVGLDIIGAAIRTLK